MKTDTVINTGLFKSHIELGAKMVPFAGYNMPINYKKGIKHEYFSVRNNVGVFDVSHMGEFIIEGNNAKGLIQYISSNDISKISPGMSQYTVMPNENGGVVDDLIIYQLDEKKSRWL